LVNQKEQIFIRLVTAYQVGQKNRNGKSIAVLFYHVFTSDWSSRGVKRQLSPLDSVIGICYSPKPAQSLIVTLIKPFGPGLHRHPPLLIRPPPTLAYPRSVIGYSVIL